jgi:hypothetical protein
VIAKAAEVETTVPLARLMTEKDRDWERERERQRQIIEHTVWRMNEEGAKPPPPPPAAAAANGRKDLHDYESNVRADHHHASLRARRCFHHGTCDSDGYRNSIETVARPARWGRRWRRQLHDGRIVNSPAEYIYLFPDYAHHITKK